MSIRMFTYKKKMKMSKVKVSFQEFISNVTYGITCNHVDIMVWW